MEGQPGEAGWCHFSNRNGTLARDICAFGPRRWEAPHVAPAAAFQVLGLESHTDGKALEGPLLPFPFRLLRSFLSI